MNVSKSFSLSFLATFVVMLPILIWASATHAMKDATVAALLAADIMLIFIGIELCLMSLQKFFIMKVGKGLSTFLLIAFTLLLPAIVWAYNAHAIKGPYVMPALVIFDFLFVVGSYGLCLLVFRPPLKYSKEAHKGA